MPPSYLGWRLVLIRETSPRSRICTSCRQNSRRSAFIQRRRLLHPIRTTHPWRYLSQKRRICMPRNHYQRKILHKRRKILPRKRQHWRKILLPKRRKQQLIKLAQKLSAFIHHKDLWYNQGRSFKICWTLHWSKVVTTDFFDIHPDHNEQNPHWDWCSRHILGMHPCETILQ